MLNRCEWMRRYVRPSDVVCFHTAPTFVDSVWQVLGPLLAKARIVALAPDVAHNPAALTQALGHQGVTVFVGVPSLLTAMLRHVQARGDTEGTAAWLILVHTRRSCQLSVGCLQMLSFCAVQLVTTAGSERCQPCRAAIAAAACLQWGAPHAQPAAPAGPGPASRDRHLEPVWVHRGGSRLHQLRCSGLAALA